ncbi:mannose-1-phosphate guanylyltransferase/mannose-6-phosphate isomerase [Enterobacter ludwigii]|uniref:mannose-1-phosphate guanylyltransferase/mannose-6-phosphate isomerase n=2 Tax=Enterobacter ludwigii TaxID=299767 RepID=UPI001CC0B292|nr:mannose-1-phosphate guanylyltransferase/mannose-6-phosphate isomerase [Enterobacter ludwigii]UAK92057.1 mannose-1-phosphate guanylyltransferase/mannose-6-phosphate isomerase [Enterobacter ludwigii]UBH88678.1 mannose-1-phosphate guanylyltransferase/mannose-6-phosphate isomerase [Enterobacter ludwigii]HEP0986425.1 mannose-1-phosphate guanylyltransferase/mannose-6-phosphate isomerase [Enterobacter ludwigii]
MNLNMNGKKKIIPVIIAGGVGSRLWPMSREEHPKQFLPLLNNTMSLLQQTLERVSGEEFEKPIVICNEEHRFLVAQQLKELGMLNNNIILEPCSKNTAPAITLAALLLQKKDNAMLVLAADHYIQDSEYFAQLIKKANCAIDDETLITFGIAPTHPETGYGYIKKGVEVSDGYFSVDAFVEKPNKEKATEYISGGMYLWNSGMFMFKPRVYLEEIKKHCTDIYHVCEKAMAVAKIDMDFTRIGKTIFDSCSSVSVDYAVMEKSSHVKVFQFDSQWSDVGAWGALWDISQKDAANNFTSGDVFASDIRNCYIKSDEIFTAAIGLDNLIVVATRDSVLVSHRNDVQKVKEAVEYLKKENRYEYKRHNVRYLPWGRTLSLVDSNKYKINFVTLEPGKTISLQKHYHRNEQWTVLSGTAIVHINGDEQIITENQTVYIPIGSEHSIHNPGVLPVEFIETQIGEYIDSSDVIRS